MLGPEGWIGFTRQGGEENFRKKKTEYAKPYSVSDISNVLSMWKWRKEFFPLSPRALDHKCLGLGVGTDKAVREGSVQGCESRSWLVYMGAQQAFGSTIKKQFCCTVQDRLDNRVWRLGDPPKPVFQQFKGKGLKLELSYLRETDSGCWRTYLTKAGSSMFNIWFYYLQYNFRIISFEVGTP